MNNKIKNYVEVLFADVPRTKRAAELKEEIMSNLNDRFEDQIREGKSENEAYGAAVASMGDIDALLAEVTPSEDFKKEADYYRRRKAKFISVGVALYILGALALIAFAALGEVFSPQRVEFFGVIGLLALLLFCAVATGLIIYGVASTPIEYKDFEEQNDRSRRENMTPKERKFKATLSIYWSVVTCIYLTVSFITFAWHTTWIIWPIAGILCGILKTINEMRDLND